jgi:hypothetical protein
MDIKKYIIGRLRSTENPLQKAQYFRIGKIHAFLRDASRTFGKALRETTNCETKKPSHRETGRLLKTAGGFFGGDQPAG